MSLYDPPRCQTSWGKFTNLQVTEVHGHVMTVEGLLNHDCTKLDGHRTAHLCSCGEKLSNPT